MLGKHSGVMFLLSQWVSQSSLPLGAPETQENGRVSWSYEFHTNNSSSSLDELVPVGSNSTAGTWWLKASSSSSSLLNSQVSNPSWATLPSPEVWIIALQGPSPLAFSAVFTFLFFFFSLSPNPNGCIYFLSYYLCDSSVCLLYYMKSSLLK